MLYGCRVAACRGEHDSQILLLDVVFLIIGDRCLKATAAQVPPTAALAPMAGVADRAFREICVRMGACWAVGEMASAKGICFGSKKTHELLYVSGAERPMAVQLFGDDPDYMAKAARQALAFAPDAIDINMGCPAPKIAGDGSGAALMKDPALVRRIVRAVVSAVDIPVTVKIRAGWDASSINAVEIAQICDEQGVSAIAIHGRTREQMYRPPADLDIIAQVKAAVHCPVIGNGDIFSATDAVKMYNFTGCDLVMIGRGAMGAPWIFAQVKSLIESGIALPAPDAEGRMAVMLEHSALACAYKSERIAVRELRKHIAWYLKGVRGAATLRREAVEVESLDDIKRIAQKCIESAE